MKYRLETENFVFESIPGMQPCCFIIKPLGKKHSAELSELKAVIAVIETLQKDEEEQHYD